MNTSLERLVWFNPNLNLQSDRQTLTIKILEKEKLFNSNIFSFITRFLNSTSSKSSALCPFEIPVKSFEMAPINRKLPLFWLWRLEIALKFGRWRRTVSFHISYYKTKSHRFCVCWLYSMVYLKKFKQKYSFHWSDWISVKLLLN